MKLLLLSLTIFLLASCATSQKNSTSSKLGADNQYIDIADHGGFSRF